MKYKEYHTLTSQLPFNLECEKCGKTSVHYHKIVVTDEKNANSQFQTTINNLKQKIKDGEGSVFEACPHCNYVNYKFQRKYIFSKNAVPIAISSITLFLILFFSLLNSIDVDQAGIITVVLIIPIMFLISSVYLTLYRKKHGTYERLKNDGISLLDED